MSVGIRITAHLSRTKKGEKPKGLCGVTGAGRLKTCKFFTVDWYLYCKQQGQDFTNNTRRFSEPWHVCQECVSLITAVELLGATDL